MVGHGYVPPLIFHRREKFARHGLTYTDTQLLKHGVYRLTAVTPLIGRRGAIYLCCLCLLYANRVRTLSLLMFCKFHIDDAGERFDILLRLL